jgi:hypothetical protein
MRSGIVGQTAGQRAVSQRTEYRCQQPGVFERRMLPVPIDQSVAYDGRAALGGAEKPGDVG